MERRLKYRLAEEIATHRMRTIIGPDWHNLSREIVDRVWDALGIKELVASDMLLDGPGHRIADARREHAAKAHLARALARKIVEGTPMQVTTIHDPSRWPYPVTRFEARLLTITRVP